MKASYISYLLATVVLLVFYSFFVEIGGWRLPFYHTPAGNIINLGEESSLLNNARLNSINGQELGVFPAIFSQNEFIFASINASLVWLQTVPNRLLSILFDFKYFIGLSFLFLLCAVWFYINTGDLYLTTFSFIASLFFASLCIALAYHKLLWLWWFCSIVLIPSLLNVGLRTTGRHIFNFLVVAETSFILFLALLVYISHNDSVALLNLEKFLGSVCLIVTLFVLALQFKRAYQKTRDQSDSFKCWLLFLGTLLGLFTPMVFFVLTLFDWVPQTLFIHSMLLASILPITLIYGTYRLQLVPFQFAMTRKLVTFLQGIFFICIYVVALLIGNNIVTNYHVEYQWIIHISFFITLILFLDPLKYFLSLYLSKFQSEKRLRVSLERIVALVTTHRSIQAVVDAFLEEVRQTLELEEVDILVAGNLFSQLQLRRNKLYKVSLHSHFWKYLQEYKFMATDYLTYGGGKREELFRFLLHNNYNIAIGVKNLKKSYFSFLWNRNRTTQKNNHKDDSMAALLIRYGPIRKFLKLKETHYLYEVARLGNMLIENYAILIAEIEKRQRIRELQIAAQLQRKMAGNKKETYDNISFSYSSQPAEAVAGDYFDLIQVDTNRIAGLLCDVSGHGLGTGYLASSLVAIVRSHLKNGINLRETVQLVNDFFLKQYRGVEFVTLIAFVLDTNTSRLEYLNAAHPGPFLFRAEGKEIVHLQNFQPVIGVLPKSYTTEKIKLKVGDRLFLYSDGVVETFNTYNVAFGEQRLQSFLEKHKHLPLEKIVSQLENHLRDFRGHAKPADDTTIAVLEFSCST